MEDSEKKICEARITPMPKDMMGPMPQVHVKLRGDNGPEKEQFLFEYYPDEISFHSEEFIGLTLAEARNLKFEKDKNYLQS